MANLYWRMNYSISKCIESQVEVERLIRDLFDLYERAVPQAPPEHQVAAVWAAVADARDTLQADLKSLSTHWQEFANQQPEVANRL